MTHAPAEFDEQLKRLTPGGGVAVYLDDEMLTLWFPPGAAAGIMDATAQKAAEEYAAKFDCRFWYFPARREGCFAKKPKTWPPKSN
jgi:hypothetical protein